MKKILLALCLATPIVSVAQQPLTAEVLWCLGRVSAVAVSPNKTQTLYRVGVTNVAEQSNKNTYYIVDHKSRQSTTVNWFDGKTFVQWDKNGIYAVDKDGVLWLNKSGNGDTWISIAKGLSSAENIRISPNGFQVAFTKHVHMHDVMGKDKYKDATKTTAQIYTSLNYRHWDTWYDGKVSHLFVAPINNIEAAKDIVKDLPYDVPTKPFGGTEDFIWSPNSQNVVFVTKAKFGTEYAISTNTDIYQYNLQSEKTTNLSEGMYGYDLNPSFSEDGRYLAWLSMARDGYEADKNDVIVYDFQTSQMRNLTQYWNESVDGGFVFSNDASKIYFNATVKGTMQVFEVANNYNKALHTVRPVTTGHHNITGIYGHNDQHLIVSKTDMNRAAELYTVGLKKGEIAPLTRVNDAAFSKIAKSEVRMRMVKTTDDKDMGVWVIYPPNFDSTKKYPTLLYCQGGPQSAVSQFYSVRWNFQLMAANGYIVVAPNRRGLPGWGTEWNEAISKDWGGQSIKDYLAAIDDVSKESYVDKDRIGAVGASYGGYSVFMLAGVHENRFKSFIAHCGLFDMKSWYGTTEEMWFANWDLGGNYWENPELKAYNEFNPSNYVQNWNTPILVIQGGMDFRVPTEQGLQAFKAAQLKGLKSKLLYFPNENHWVLNAHNGLVWQREFFGWLKETL